MSLERRVEILKKDVAFLNENARKTDAKLDDIMKAIVDVHADLTALDNKVDGLYARFDQLPDIIARVVAPLVRGDDRC